MVSKLCNVCKQKKTCRYRNLEFPDLRKPMYKGTKWVGYSTESVRLYRQKYAEFMRECDLRFVGEFIEDKVESTYDIDSTKGDEI